MVLNNIYVICGTKLLVLETRSGGVVRSSAMCKKHKLVVSLYARVTIVRRRRGLFPQLYTHFPAHVYWLATDLALLCVRGCVYDRLHHLGRPGSHPDFCDRYVQRLGPAESAKRQRVGRHRRATQAPLRLDSQFGRNGERLRRHTKKARSKPSSTRAIAP